MLVSYNWLQELVPNPFSPSELAEKLTQIGLEVCHTQHINKVVDKVVVGEIIEIHPHPNADKLNVVTVKTSKITHRVVCGAKNIQPENKILLALEGCQLPGGLKLKKTSIRGVESSSMICSKEELGLEEKSEGVWLLPARTSLDDQYQDICGKEDFIYDIDLTANRSDCQSVIGIAREVAILKIQNKITEKSNLTRKDIDKAIKAYFPNSTNKDNIKKNQDISVQNSNPELCSRYTAQLIKGIKVGPSPEWLQQRLSIHGLRPINNIVDVTNYFLLLWGQPMHAFDWHKLQGKKIHIRQAKPREEILALNGETYQLNGETLVIADETHAQAIAGVIGGMGSGVTANTTEILLECASFDSNYIRHISRQLKISTDSSIRFSRLLDRTHMDKINQQATEMIMNLAGGFLSSNLTDIYLNKAKKKELIFDYSDSNKILGKEIEYQEINKIFTSIGCQSKTIDSREANKKICLEIPSYRHDLNAPWDLVEEIARIHQFENFPEQVPAIVNANYNLPYRDQKPLVQQLNSLGYSQVINDSFVENKFVDKSYEPNRNHSVKIVNPVNTDFSYLRKNLLFGMLNTVARNLDHKNDNLQVFEIGHCFSQQNEVEEKYRQKLLLGLLLSGKRLADSWFHDSQSIDIYHLKGDLEQLLEQKRIAWKIEHAEHSHFTKNQNFNLLHRSGKFLGAFGKLNKKTLKNFAISVDCYFAELDYDSLSAFQSTIKVKELSVFPAIKRDFAIICNLTQEIEPLIQFINRHSVLIDSCVLKDVYQGKGIPQDKRSFVFSISWKSAKETLNREKVESLEIELVKGIISKFKVEMR